MILRLGTRFAAPTGARTGSHGRSSNGESYPQRRSGATLPVLVDHDAKPLRGVLPAAVPDRLDAGTTALDLRLRRTRFFRLRSRRPGPTRCGRPGARPAESDPCRVRETIRAILTRVFIIGGVIRRSGALLLTLVLSLSVAACGANGSDVRPDVEYKPVLLPVKFVVDTDGVYVTGESSMVTPIGVFTLNANYNLVPSQNSTYVVIRNRKQRPEPADNVYKVRTGGDRLTAVLDGHIEIAVANGMVTIDVTAAKVSFIQLRQTRVVAAAAKPTGMALWWHNSVAKWNSGYARSPYKPFVLTRWAYDDSTIGKYYGAGFIWFLIRLAVAIVFVLPDLVLTLVFLVGQFCYFFFGPTGANIVWGVFLLLIVWFVLHIAWARRS